MTMEELAQRLATYLCRKAHPKDGCRGSCIHGMRTDAGDAEYPCRFTLQVSTFFAAIEEAGYTLTEGWQPIETAPRDGTWFKAINGRGECKHPRPFECCSAPPPDGQKWASGAGWRERGREWPAYPTHWMTLAAPPQAVNADPEWDEAGDRRRGQANVGRFVEDFIKATKGKA